MWNKGGTSQGMSLLDVSREKGFAATIIELCDNSAIIMVKSRWNL